MITSYRGHLGHKVSLLVLTALVLSASLLIPKETAGASTSPTYYVSIGDSYSIGYQPNPVVSRRFGYTRFVVATERQRGTNLTLVNFGCAGATTGSLLTSNGCVLPAINGAAYTTVPQATAATSFIAAHRGHIGLITISIGGNDVTKCGTAASPIACVTSAVPEVAKNITTLLRQVHTAAGNGVPIVGLTYPDVLLGAWVHPPTAKALAALSVAAFKLALNPILKRAYEDNGGTFVDVTAATGAYTPLTHTVVFPPYGKIPVAVAKVCTYTWYCAAANIHPRTVGYQFIAQLIVKALPKKLG